MMKNKTLERLMRLLITLLGAGLGAALALGAIPLMRRYLPGFDPSVTTAAVVYLAACALGAGLCFAFSAAMIDRTMKLIASIESRWDAMPMQQIALTSMGMIVGLVVAALTTQLILSAGSSLLTWSFSALTYLVLGYAGMRVGYRRYHTGKRFSRRRRRHGAASLLDDALLEDEDEAESAESVVQPAAKYLDTSVLIDGRILDVLKTGFLEGELVVPQFVVLELQRVADSGDAQRRARGRRGLDVLGKLQKEFAVTVDETDCDDAEEVDVKLLRLCRDNGGAVLTNDYNLNKVAGVTGIRVLNINDLANALKPILTAGEEMTVQVTREGKEPGQGVAYLDDGTMIVVEGGKRFVGERVTVVVSSVLQTSAGRMIFTKVKAREEQAAG